MSKELNQTKKTARRRSLAIGKLKRPQDIFRRQKLPRGLRVKIVCMHSPAPVCTENLIRVDEVTE